MSGLVQIGDFNFRFECQPGCTECCTHEGLVLVTPEDISRISAYLETSQEEFRRRYCVAEDGYVRLVEPEKPCIFLREGGCSIHEVKPLQCRAFPYWPENVENKKAWKALKKYCPGIGVGPIISREIVREQAQLCKDELPDA